MFKPQALLLTAALIVSGGTHNPAAAQSAFVTEDIHLRLAGTLTLPRGGGPFPAVIVSVGSGFERADETPFEHKTFRALADHLTGLGLAVLRVDHRGVAAESLAAVATTRDFARDVRDAMAFLESHRDIVPDRIGVLGHGEGASIAAMIAAANPDVRFLVMLAGAGVPGDQLLRLQFEALMWSQDVGGATVARELAIRDRVFAQVKSETDGVAHVARRRAVIEELTAAEAPDEKERVRALVEGLFAAASPPWVRFFLWHDPGSELARVRCPVLALIGERDLQVPYRDNVPAIRAALAAGGNRDYEVRSLPNLDHLLRAGRPPVSNAANPPASGGDMMAPAAVTLISNWIRARVEE